MIVTTGLDDCDVELLVKHLEEITYSIDPFITRSMKIKKFVLDLMRNYLADKGSRNVFAELKEIDSLALKKFGKHTPEKYKERLHDELDELSFAFGSIEHVFELFDVIAFTYAYFINGLGFNHESFETLLLEKARVVKDRVKVPEDAELCPNPEIPCDCCPRGESVNCPLETEEEFFDNEDEARKKEDYEKELTGEL